MNLSVGIVGFPNVGKSTLFNALLKKQQALAASYPFATIEPNVGMAEVPDDRLSKLAEIAGTSTIKPAAVEFVDIAGLVKGASKGEGLGNKFLAHIRETKIIAQVLRDFTDEQVSREGTVNPKEDLRNIRLELQLADLATLKKQTPPKGTTNQDALQRWKIIEQFKQNLEKGRPVLDWRQAQQVEGQPANSQLIQAVSVAKELCLLTAKPEIMVINVDEDCLSQQDELTQYWANQLNLELSQIVIISAQIESELATLSESDQQAYLQDLGIEQSGLERLAQVAYDILQLQSFFTAGEKEVRAWTIKKGTKAPQAAAVVHSDFEQHFIKAKVVDYRDFIQHNGWTGAKAAGKVRLEGRDYVMQEGDVVEFMIGR